MDGHSTTKVGHDKSRCIFIFIFSSSCSFGSQWPVETTRPNTGKIISLTDSRYLQSLNAKVLQALDGRNPFLTAKPEEKRDRQEKERKEEEALVCGLSTPVAGVREQLLEEILRQAILIFLKLHLGRNND